MTGSGFALALPDTWFEVALDPRTRATAHRELVDERVRALSDLAPHRATLLRLLARTADEALAAGAVYAAVMQEVLDGEVLPASLTVSLLDAEPDWRAQLGSGREPERAGGTWRRVAQVAGGGVRVFGVEDVDLPDGRWLRSVTSQLYVPVPGERQVAVVACASPAIDLADAWLELFEAVSSTFVLVPAAVP